MTPIFFSVWPQTNDWSHKHINVTHRLFLQPLQLYFVDKSGWKSGGNELVTKAGELFSSPRDSGWDNL